ncbi:uncharacterized [Tachysurus ichikawai]
MLRGNAILVSLSSCIGGQEEYATAYTAAVDVIFPNEKALQARTMAPVSVDSRPAEKEMEGKEEGGVVVLAKAKWR